MLSEFGETLEILEFETRCREKNNQRKAQEVIDSCPLGSFLEKLFTKCPYFLHSILVVEFLSATLFAGKVCVALVLTIRREHELYQIQGDDGIK